MTELKKDAGVRWPSLRVEEWAPTRETLHLWTQIIGKIRLTHAPMVNHWWQVPLYVTPRGLTTSAIPQGHRIFDIEFDFLDHELQVRTSDGAAGTIALAAKSVADFYGETVQLLDELGIEVAIQARPNEVEPAIPFAQDRQHADYDPDAVRLFWYQLISAERVLQVFRSRFIGKVSPVHFFWGGFDLACTRFSGRRAPLYSGKVPNCADHVMIEGYSHELSSCGFWPGGGDEGAFYSYAYPEPEGFADAPVRPDGAFYSREFGEFLLPYEAVRTAPDPEGAVLQFLQDTYAAAADHARWDRADLERDPTTWTGRP